MTEPKTPTPQVERRIVVDRPPVVARGLERVLVTNDDGFDALGIRVLAQALAREFAPGPGSAGSRQPPASRCVAWTSASTGRTRWTGRRGWP